MRVDYCDTYNGSKSKWQNHQTLNNGLKWHMTCVFLFALKYLCNIYAIRLYIYHQFVQTLCIPKSKYR